MGRRLAKPACYTDRPFTASSWGPAQDPRFQEWVAAVKRAAGICSILLRGARGGGHRELHARGGVRAAGPVRSRARRAV